MGFIPKMEERKPNKNNPRKRILSLYNGIKKQNARLSKYFKDSRAFLFELFIFRSDNQVLL